MTETEKYKLGFSLTLMVTLMALFMLPLCNQPCLVMPPFWEPSEAVSCRRTSTVRPMESRVAEHLEASTYT